MPRDESHLVVRAMRAAFELMGAQPPGLRLSCRNVIPHARGLGSSSAAIVAGVVLARGLVAGGQLLASDEALFDLAADLEGHPDNVAPAFYGGFVISGREDDHWYAVRVGVDPRVTAVVFVPPTGVETTVARGLLPEVGARTPTRPPTPGAPPCSSPRSPVSPSTCSPPPATGCTRTSASPRCRRRSRSYAACARDGVPAVVSGAGPTVLAFGTTDTSGAHRRTAPDGWAAVMTWSSSPAARPC